MANNRSEFSSTEVRAGLLVLFSGAVLILFIGAVLKYRPQADTKSFYVFASETGGLGRSADVRFGGLIVGRVAEVDYDPEDHSRVRMRVEVATSTPVNTESSAFVGQTTLTSEKHLEITTGTGDAALLEENAEIPSTVGGLFGDLSGLTATAEQLLADLTILMGVTDGDGTTIFAADNGRTIADLLLTVESSLADLRVMLGVVDEDGNPIELEDRTSLSELMVGLDGAVAEGDELLGEVRGVLEDNRESLGELLDNASELSASAKKVVDDLGSLIVDNRENIDGTLEGARNALAELDGLVVEFEELAASLVDVLERNGPTLDDTLRDLSDTMRNLEEVTRTLADQPQSIIRGKQPVGRQ